MLADAEVSAFFVQDRGLPRQPSSKRRGCCIRSAPSGRRFSSMALSGRSSRTALPLTSSTSLWPAGTRARRTARHDIRRPGFIDSSGIVPGTPRTRCRGSVSCGASTVREPGRASLEVGCSLLSLNRATTNRLLRRANAELASNAGDDFSFEGTRLAAVASVVRRNLAPAVLDLWRSRSAERSTREQFERGVNDPAAHRDLDSRWVAAHLLVRRRPRNVLGVGGMSSGRHSTRRSPNDDAGRTASDDALAASDRVAPPRDSEQSPLRPDVRRAVLTFPTSAGKTLLTQLVVANHLATVNTPVCVVAPSHSLCREIRYGLMRPLGATPSRGRGWAARRPAEPTSTCGCDDPRAPRRGTAEWIGVNCLTTLDSSCSTRRILSLTTVAVRHSRPRSAGSTS